MEHRPSQGKLILPPFGRILMAYQESSIHLNDKVFIYVGHKAKEHSFAETKNGTLSTFLPYHEDFKNYYWPIKDQKIVVADTGKTEENVLKKFCLYLITFYPKCIFFYSEKHPNQLYLPPRSTSHGQ